MLRRDAQVQNLHVRMHILLSAGSRSDGPPAAAPRDSSQIQTAANVPLLRYAKSADRRSLAPVDAHSVDVALTHGRYGVPDMRPPQHVLALRDGPPVSVITASGTLASAAFVVTVAPRRLAAACSR